MEGDKLNLRNLCRICGSYIVLKYWLQDYKKSQRIQCFASVLRHRY